MNRTDQSVLYTLAIVALAHTFSGCASETPRVYSIPPPTRMMVGQLPSQIQASGVTAFAMVPNGGCVAIATMGHTISKAEFWRAEGQGFAVWVPVPTDDQIMVTAMYLDPTTGEVKVRSGQNKNFVTEHNENSPLVTKGTCAELEAALCAPLSNYAMLVDCP